MWAEICCDCCLYFAHNLITQEGAHTESSHSAAGHGRSRSVDIQADRHCPSPRRDYGSVRVDGGCFYLFDAMLTGRSLPLSTVHFCLLEFDEMD